MTTPNDAAPHDDSPPPSPPGDTPPTSTDEDETPDGEQDTDAPDDDQDDDNLTQEAKRYRLRLREVEGERDGLRQQLDAMRQEQIADAVHDAGYSARLVDLLDVDTVLTDAGAIDGEKLSAAIAATASDYGMSTAARRPRPTPGQGGGNGTRGTSSWSSALQGQ